MGDGSEHEYECAVCHRSSGMHGHGHCHYDRAFAFFCESCRAFPGELCRIGPVQGRHKICDDRRLIVGFRDDLIGLVPCRMAYHGCEWWVSGYTCEEHGSGS